MLVVNDLCIYTKDNREPIVQSVSFTVGDGETLGLIGESGSGKSMTSKCIMRLLDPHRFGITGSVRQNGEEILSGKLPRNFRGNCIGMITQNPMTAFAPMIKLGRQLEMGFDTKGRTAKKEYYERLDEALKSVNLHDMKKIVNSYPDELSGGMLQRVMIALTMMKKPELLIADECTTAVDAASEYMILGELEKMKQSGMSMIVVTHDFGVAARLCDSVAVMKSGRIIEYGRTSDVLGSPQDEYTGQLVSASVMFREDVC